MEERRDGRDMEEIWKREEREKERGKRKRGEKRAEKREKEDEEKGRRREKEKSEKTRREKKRDNQRSSVDQAFLLKVFPVLAAELLESSWPMCFDRYSFAPLGRSDSSWAGAPGSSA